MKNIPDVKLGLIAVLRDCFVISLSERRRAALAKAYAATGGAIFETGTTVENEIDMLRAVEEVKAAGCNALVVLLGNRYPHHGAVAFGHVGRALHTVFDYLGIGHNISYNRPKGVLYPNENPF